MVNIHWLQFCALLFKHQHIKCHVQIIDIHGPRSMCLLKAVFLWKPHQPSKWIFQVCLGGEKSSSTVGYSIQQFELWFSFVLFFSCSIQRYAVIPLSTNSGLIGWVPHCDTLHALIRDYREKKKILLNIEHRIMLRVKGKSSKFFGAFFYYSSVSSV